MKTRISYLRCTIFDLIYRPNGGWICQNIFYLGYSGIFEFCGLKIAGVSGIYSERYFEKPRDPNRPDYFYRKIDFDRLLSVFFS